MAAVVRTGARVVLSEQGTTDDHLRVQVGVFAELDDGRTIEVDPARHGCGGPRRSLGAVWVRYEGDGSELPGFDRELYERDPYGATTQALIQGYRLRAKDIEDSVRLDFFEGGIPAAGPEEGGELDPDEHRLDNERRRDANWGNLIAALRAVGVDATSASLRELPFRIDFDQSVIDELAR